LALDEFDCNFCQNSELQLSLSSLKQW